jgi:hypothetical protein
MHRGNTVIEGLHTGSFQNAKGACLQTPGLPGSLLATIKIRALLTHVEGCFYRNNVSIDTVEAYKRSDSGISKHLGKPGNLSILPTSRTRHIFLGWTPRSTSSFHATYVIVDCPEDSLRCFQLSCAGFTLEHLTIENSLIA